MKTIVVRLPEPLYAEIEAESRRRRLSKSDVVRDRLRGASGSRKARPTLDAIADLIGSVDGLDPELSAEVKRQLKATGYGRRRTG
jgi:Arc/MetJ-type ribon-helix-helix transcriptional regulator